MGAMTLAEAILFLQRLEGGMDKSPKNKVLLEQYYEHATAFQKAVCAENGWPDDPDEAEKLNVDTSKVMLGQAASSAMQDLKFFITDHDEALFAATNPDLHF